ncbi:hypothetical protein SANTM175S_04219 [Streptomyces antimycoticus]
MACQWAVQRLPGDILDYGELEALTRLETQWTQQVPPAAPGPQDAGPRPRPRGARRSTGTTVVTTATTSGAWAHARPEN